MRRKCFQREMCSEPGFGLECLGRASLSHKERTMVRLRLLLPLTVFATSLLAQSTDSASPREEKYSLRTLTKYCATVQDFSKSQQPRVFAQVFSSPEASSGWVEFSSKTAWRNAGRPRPLALVWAQAGQTVRVAITAKSGYLDEEPYADYCYRPDGSLARLRAVPELQTDCDPFLLHCSFTFRGERLYPPEGQLPRLSGAPAKPSVVAQMDQGDRDSFFLRILQSERTSFSIAPLDWPEYLNVRDLPFQHFVDVSAK